MRKPTQSEIELIDKGRSYQVDLGVMVQYHLDRLIPNTNYDFSLWSTLLRCLPTEHRPGISDDEAVNILRAATIADLNAKDLKIKQLDSRVESLTATITDGNAQIEAMIKSQRRASIFDW